MPSQYYSEALKLGLRQKRAAVSAGQSPNVAALEDIIEKYTSAEGKKSVYMQIPMDLIGGTVTSSRASMFSPGFLPLAAENSEFAMKWDRLCQAHLDEGIREPVKAYEYMNRYYIDEGNKRVSVLKYFDAVSVYAKVISIIPEQDGSWEIELYNDLCSFKKLSGIVHVEFSKPGGYKKLQQLIGKDPDEEWTEDDRREFNSDYFHFRTAYESAGGKQLNTTVGDALLTYLDIYGYSLLRGQTMSAIKANIIKAWEEISLQDKDDQIDLKLVPQEEKKQGLLDRVLSVAEPKSKIIKVAFIHDSTPETSSWTHSHELARKWIQEQLQDTVESSAYFNALENDPYDMISKAIADGNEVIFTTSSRLMLASLRAAIDNPTVRIYNCSLNQPHRYIRTYYPRMYEAKFVIGAVAGAMADGNEIGYICDYPIFGQIAGINAFALGAQMVNPTVKVFLEWGSLEGGLDSAIGRLSDKDIHLYSSQDLMRHGDYSHIPGLNLVTDGKTVNLATPMCLWGSYYEAIIKRIRSNMADTEYRESGRALNYFWGMSAGVVGLEYSDLIPNSTRKLANLLERSISTGTCNPFLGPLYTQNGKILENNDLMSPEQIIRMDYLMDNVIGSIPRYEDLNETAKATVDVIGIAPSTKEAVD